MARRPVSLRVPRALHLEMQRMRCRAQRPPAMKKWLLVVVQGLALQVLRLVVLECLAQPVHRVAALVVLLLVHRVAHL